MNFQVKRMVKSRYGGIVPVTSAPRRLMQEDGGPGHLELHFKTEFQSP